MHLRSSPRRSRSPGLHCPSHRDIDRAAPTSQTSRHVPVRDSVCRLRATCARAAEQESENASEIRFGCEGPLVGYGPGLSSREGSRSCRCECYRSLNGPRSSGISKAATAAGDCEGTGKAEGVRSRGWADCVMYCLENTVSVCCRVGVLLCGCESATCCLARDRARESQRREPEMIVVACPGDEYGCWRGIHERA